MFLRHRHQDDADADTRRGHGWSERARRREQASADAELISELRWQWRCACGSTSLAEFIYTPSGATRAVPTITHVDLGPPITLTVRVRPGQAIADFYSAAPALARALNMDAVEVHPITPQWVRIVLVRSVRVPDRPPMSDWESVSV